jgi:hypothetical protein
MHPDILQDHEDMISEQRKVQYKDRTPGLAPKTRWISVYFCSI